MSVTSSTPIQSLITVFTPSSTCLSTLYVYQEATNIYPSEYIGGALQTPLQEPGSDCFPPNYASAGFYSPGICPSGYTVACSNINIYNQDVIETQGTCCPSGYLCLTGLPATAYWGCLSFPSPSLTTTFISAFGTETFTSNKYSTTVLAASNWINANGITVRWQSTDTAVLAHLTPGLFSSTITTSSGTSSTSSTALVTNGPPLGTTNGTTSSPAGLSTGAIIGIGITIPLLLIGLAIAAFLFFRRLRKNRSGHQFQPVNTDPHKQFGDPHGQFLKSELHAHALAEMDGRGQILEPSSNTIYEAPDTAEAQPQVNELDAAARRSLL